MFKSNQTDAKQKEMNAFTPWSSKDMEKAYKSGTVFWSFHMLTEYQLPFTA